MHSKCLYWRRSENSTRVGVPMDLKVYKDKGTGAAVVVGVISMQDICFIEAARGLTYSSTFQTTAAYRKRASMIGILSLSYKI